MQGAFINYNHERETTASAVFHARELLQFRSEPANQGNTSTFAPIGVAQPEFGISAVRAAVQPARSALFYALICLLFTVAGVAAVWNSNRVYAPEMYDDAGLTQAAAAFANGQNYAVFDLNLNIRRLRDLHLAQMKVTPDVAIMGASHWQEANSGLVRHLNFYNAHVHRDYWEDMLAVTEIFVRHDRLPKRLIISVRDKLFTPMANRKDFLWEPGIPYYRPMAARLGVETEGYWTSFPYQRLRERLTLSLLFSNVRRWYNAEELPHPTDAKHFETLDTLLPDGSITWSNQRMQLFTPQRAEREAIAFAEKQRNNPPMVEERGVVAFNKLLDFLKSQGVTVYLVQPPFNPIYYDRLQGSPYAEGLHNIEVLTQKIAADHGLKIIGGFNPHKVGCDASMFIDAEHSNATCLQHIFDEFSALDIAQGAK